MRVERSEHDATLRQVLDVALTTARELGYKVENMRVTLSVQNGQAIAYFETIPRVGHAVLGGDLTVIVDPRTFAVLDVQRGQ